MFMATNPAIQPDALEGMIHVIRGQRVMLDADLATLYGVTTKRLKEQHRRNLERFPKRFAFVLTRQEVATLRSQIATSKGRGGTRYMPIAFTEHGVIMLASVLNSQVAIDASVRVVEGFIRMREMLAATAELSNRVDELERRLGGHDEDLETVFAAIRQLIDPPAGDHREMGFHTLKEKAPAYRVPTRKKRV
jgi:hypothetical protein